jgi:CubicO group peptidase (beta-lactamase class C family)
VLLDQQARRDGGALRLVEEGWLGLDDDVNDRLTSWRLPTDGAVVTVRQLLGHTAGLTYCWYRGFRRGAPIPTLIDVLERGQGAVVLTNGDDGARVVDAVFEALGRRYGWPKEEGA